MSRAVQGSLLLIGSGVLADSLAKHLGALVAERATCEQGPGIARVLAPELIVLAGDAARDRGSAVVALLAQAEPLVPVLVIWAPNLGVVPLQAPPRHVALLSPEGGMAECARRLRAVVELFMEEGLAHCSFQQLADTVAPIAKPTTSTLGMPLQAKPANVTQPIATKPASALKAPSPAAKPLTSQTLKTATLGVTPAKVQATKPAQAEAQAAKGSAPSSELAQPLAGSAVANDNRSQLSLSRQSPLQQTSKASLSTPKPGPAAASKLAGSRLGGVPSTAGAVAKKPLAAASARSQTAEHSLPQVVSAAAPPSAAADPAVVVARNESPAIASTLLGDAPTVEVQRDISPSKPERPPAAVTPVPASLDTPIAKTPEIDFSVTAMPAAPPVHEALGASEEAINPTTPPAAVSVTLRDGEFTVSISSRPTDAPAAEAHVTSASSERPTEPPEVQAPQAKADAVQPHAAAASRVQTMMGSPFVAPVQAAAAELEIAVSLSEPAPHATVQRIPAKSVSNATANSTVSLRTPRRSADPFEPARTPAQRPELPHLREAAAQQTAIAIAAAAEPDITVSMSEPPVIATASSATSVTITAAPARARKARRAGNPLDPAPIRPQQAPAQSLPGLRVMPASAAAFSEVQLSEPQQHSKAGWALALFAVAAVGCGLALFQLLNETPATSGGRKAALGALQQAAVAPKPSAPISAPTAPAATPAPAPVPGAPPVKDPYATVFTNGAAPTAAATSAAGPRRPGLEHDPVVSDEPSSPQSLVDEGMALFKQGRLGLAEAAYLKALKLEPSYARAMTALVRVHIARRDGAEAVRWAKQLVEQQPQNGANLLLLGDAQQLRGDLAGAEEAWTESARYGNATAKQRLE